MKLTLLSALLVLSTTALAETPAQRKIEWARKSIEADATDARNHNQLALGLARRARETANPEFYLQAQAALADSLRVAPGNYEARKLQVWTLLGQHEFALALVHARELNRLVPDDAGMYGFMADALVELGELEEAEEAVNWMLKLKPGNVPGMTRAAYLRELFGDVQGAVELMMSAFHSIDPSESEDRAWVLTHAAHLELSRNGLENAEFLLTEANRLFPDYHYALAQWAELRRAQGRFEDAVGFLETRAKLAPHPENFAQLAWALERTGEQERANELLNQFEESALGESGNWDNANRDLIAHYAATNRSAEALALARNEVSRRQDIYTLDAYAWALHSAGQFNEARIQIERALESGIQDAQLLYHAGAIALAQNDPDSSSEYLRKSLEQNATSAVAPLVEELIAKLK